MKNFWYVANFGYLALGLYCGYYSTAPDRLQHIIPDPVAWLAILIVMPLLAIGTVYYSIRCWQNILPRPSWNRNSINWWEDPLQSLFMTMCTTAMMAMGAVLRAPAIGSAGFWMFGVYCSVAIGFAVGQMVVYRIYRRHIIDA
jgi:tellurite resistance protein TehA-like permease